ncbi:hypothetical protein, partial [Candidatus Darwinibacter acetoxidans]
FGVWVGGMLSGLWLTLLVLPNHSDCHCLWWFGGCGGVVGDLYSGCEHLIFLLFLFCYSLTDF